MLSVRCQANATLDAKGRLALPAPVRRALSEHHLDGLVLAYRKGAIWAWTPADFESRVEAPLAELDPFSEAGMNMAHALLSTAQDVKVDKTGRVQIPLRLRELAQIDRDIVVHSLLHRLEIWDASAWAERFKTAMEQNASMDGIPRSRV